MCDFLMSAPLRGAQGLRCGQVRPHFKGKWDASAPGPQVLDGWRWGLGAARSARMSRSHLGEVGHQGLPGQTAFVDAPTITVVKDGGFFGHPQSDMGNVGLKRETLTWLSSLEEQ